MLLTILSGAIASPQLAFQSVVRWKSLQQHIQKLSSLKVFKDCIKLRKTTGLNLDRYCIVTLDTIPFIRTSICDRSVLFLLLSLLLYLLQVLFSGERRSWFFFAVFLALTHQLL
ncbi:hypothetical protein [Nostoc sp.]|uniref:hypothetical protein n=1 Tax=Nostoc sp. TaxID=1180 RepID=UPI002FF98E43